MFKIDKDWFLNTSGFTFIYLSNSKYQHTYHPFIKICFPSLNYKIYSLTGGLFFGSDINACLEMQKKVEKDLSILFKNTERLTKKQKYSWDKTGKSYIHFIVHFFDTEDQIEISCYEFAKHLNRDHYLIVSPSPLHLKKRQTKFKELFKRLDFTHPQIMQMSLVLSWQSQTNLK